ncbi:VOC family protein [Bacillus sp. 2205SS5-2]|uniref:VOC family protein n=1 Tax=Bacillus sp. 2205SS5-2 TaxID=3109031 RepID=UPI003006E5F3
MNIHHIGILVENIEASMSFYLNFGFEEMSKFRFKGEQIVLMSNGGAILELILETKCKNHHHFCLEVESIDHWLTHLAKVNIAPIEGPYALNNGWNIVFFQGLDGEVIELLEKRKL